MRADDQIGDAIPPNLLAELEALAEAERRAPVEILREAVERYLHERPSPSRAKLTSQEAGERILESRPRHRLPEGVTIRDMIDYGRA